jgi:leucyl-tRNA synthetase
VAESVVYPVQINGKLRGRIEVAADADEASAAVRTLAEVAGQLGDREPRKVIVVPGRMVSVVL